MNNWLQISPEKTQAIFYLCLWISLPIQLQKSMVKRCV